METLSDITRFGLFQLLILSNIQDSFVSVLLNEMNILVLVFTHRLNIQPCARNLSIRINKNKYYAAIENECFV